MKNNLFSHPLLFNFQSTKSLFKLFSPRIIYIWGFKVPRRLQNSHPMNLFSWSFSPFSPLLSVEVSQTVVPATKKPAGEKKVDEEVFIVSSLWHGWLGYHKEVDVSRDFGNRFKGCAKWKKNIEHNSDFQTVLNQLLTLLSKFAV